MDLQYDVKCVSTTRRYIGRSTQSINRTNPGLRCYFIANRDQMKGIAITTTECTAVCFAVHGSPG